MVMKLRENNNKHRPLSQWDHHDHGSHYNTLKFVRDQLLPHGCKFRSSARGEITVRTEDGCYTVYIHKKRPDRRWRVGYRPDRQEELFESWPEVLASLRKYGFCG